VIKEISLVPKSRFGALLSAQRRSTQIGLAEIANNSFGMFTVRDLQQIEKGRKGLDDESIEYLVKLYGLEPNNTIPQRQQLVVDFQSYKIESGDFDSKIIDEAPQEVLSRYVSLVYKMRGEKPGTKISFRSGDITTLSKVLGLTPVTVESYLYEIASDENSQVSFWSKMFENKFAVPGAGLLVAVTSVGSLVLVASPSIASASTPETDQITNTYALTEIEGMRDFKIKTSIEQNMMGALTQINGRFENIENRRTVPEQKFSSNVVSNRTVLEDPITKVGHRAESLISYDWQTLLPDWDVKYLPKKPGYRGLTTRSEKTIEIYISGDESPAEVAGILAHEIGHAIDVTYLDDSDRLDWLESRDMPTIWWAGEGLGDFSVGAGDFAEAVAKLWVGSPSDSEYGEFSAEQLQLVERLLSNI